MGVTNGKAEGRRAREETAQMGLGACGNIVDERFAGRIRELFEEPSTLSPEREIAGAAIFGKQWLAMRCGRGAPCEGVERLHRGPFELARQPQAPFVGAFLRL